MQVFQNDNKPVMGHVKWVLKAWLSCLVGCSGRSDGSLAARSRSPLFPRWTRRYTRKTLGSSASAARGDDYGRHLAHCWHGRATNETHSTQHRWKQVSQLSVCGRDSTVSSGCALAWSAGCWCSRLVAAGPLYRRNARRSIVGPWHQPTSAH